jgi:cytoskeletal protein CcmA (bactofilin family)
MKKIAISIITVMVILISLSGIYASSEIGILDTEYTDTVYKFSENSDIKLPFVRITAARMIMDKDLNKSGISYANENISVINNLKGIQTLISSDTVRISGNMEYGIVIAPTVIIEGTIDKSMIILSQKVTIAENAVIKEDLLCTTNEIDILGSIEGNLLGAIENIDISGNISQDLRADVANITLGEKATIQGNIYLRSYNSIDISNKYPNAKIEIMEHKAAVYTMDIWKILRVSTIFAVLYLLFSSKTNIIKKALNKVKTYKVSTVMFGLASIMLIPLLFLIIILLSLIGLGIIAFPVTVLYSAFMITAFTLSTLVVGSVISEYIINKYSDKISGNIFKLILSLLLFFVLNMVCDLPTVGSTLSLILCILSAGIVFTTMFRKIKE